MQKKTSYFGYLQTIENFIHSLDKETLQALEDNSKEAYYTKGDFLLQAGEICTNSYYLIDGIARKYYIENGKEITTDLLFPDDIALSFQSYVLQKESQEFIQLLTDAQVSITNYHSFNKLKQRYPKLVALDLMMTEFYTMWVEDQMFRLRTMNASQRYRLLLEEQPAIIQYVPLTHIASFLGISLETLSRIRAKMQS